jgi:peptidoglycan/xylan/chitin deacetylase (PgdA/CDA1 family)
VDSRDWENTSAEAMVTNALSNVRGGSILLFHDYMGKRSNTLEAIEILIPKLLSRGYKFVTVSELLEQNH